MMIGPNDETIVMLYRGIRCVCLCMRCQTWAFANSKRILFKKNIILFLSG